MSEKTIPSLLAGLLERIESREALDLEFKAAHSALPRDVWPTVSAFANTQGGWIVLGVAEEPAVYVLEGVAEAHRMLQTFFNQLRNSQKISHPVCGANDASIETVGSKELIVIRVPAAPRKSKPVYVDGNPYAGTYVRRHTGDYHCTKPEVDRMMREASDVAADSALLPHFGLDDLDRDSLGRYRRLHLTVSPAAPRNAYDDKRFLQAIGGYRYDRDLGQEGVTAAGLLLLGTEEALREWRGRHMIDYRLLPSDTAGDLRWEDRVPWEGNLLGAFEAVYPKLIEGQAVPFRLQGVTRIDQSPLHVALREALVNLLVHTDYSEKDVSLIMRSPSGYLFRNPGSSRVSGTDLLTGDRSDPRNQELVRMFRYVGLAEEAGSGMPRIMRAWRELGFRLPSVDVGTERYEFTLALRYVHLLAEEDRAWLHALGGEWSEAEQLALVLARHEGDVDNLRLRRLTGQHPADATKVLGGLRSRGLLQLSGVGRGARYQLGLAAPAIANGSGATASLEGMSSDSEGSAPSLEDTHSDSEGRETIPELRWAQLERIAQPARQQSRLDPVLRDAILVQLCRLTPLTLHQLAQLTGRSVPYLREVLRALVALRRLTYLYPDRLHHPRQKYVAVTPASQ
ncbi:MAG: putative DNA binding domain-containing protein [Chloroflexota bacterium]|nr:putative DNA binding domain-containing protein [Chloroflexota bacterium]